MDASEISLGVIDQSLSEEEREENLQLYQDQQAEFEKQAQELLGDENFEALDTYTESARGILSKAQAGQFETRVNETKEMMKMNFSFQGDGDDESE